MSAIPNLDAIFKQYGDEWCRARGGKCDRMNVVQKGYEDRALKVSDQHIQYYDSADSQIEPQTGSVQTMDNDTSVSQTQTVNLSKTTSSSFTWQLQEGFELGMSAEFAVGVPPIASAKTTISTKLSFSSTQSKTESESRTWQISQPIAVPPRTSVTATLLIDEQRFSQPFHAVCTLSGYVCSNSPDRVDGHYFWFHSIASILSRFPQPGFTVLPGGNVLYSGDGMFEGLMGVRNRVSITEKPLDHTADGVKTYVLTPALFQGAGIAPAAELSDAVEPQAPALA